MIDKRQFSYVALRDERWNETLSGIVRDGWDFDTQVDYWGVRIADAVVLERTSLERVSSQLNTYSLLHEEMSVTSGGDLANLVENYVDEAAARWLAYKSLRNGKNRVKDDRHRRRHLADYNARLAMLHSVANIGLGRLEARDLGLDNLWYDREES